MTLLLRTRTWTLALQWANALRCQTRSHEIIREHDEKDMYENRSTKMKENILSFWEAFEEL